MEYGANLRLPSKAKAPGISKGEDLSGTEHDSRIFACLDDVTNFNDQLLQELSCAVHTSALRYCHVHKIFSRFLSS